MTPDDPTGQTPADRALQLFDGLDSSLEAVKALADELAQRATQDRLERRRAERVANAYWHLQEAKKSLFKAGKE